MSVGHRAAQGGPAGRSAGESLAGAGPRAGSGTDTECMYLCCASYIYHDPVPEVGDNAQAEGPFMARACSPGNHVQLFVRWYSMLDLTGTCLDEMREAWFAWREGKDCMLGRACLARRHDGDWRG